AATVEIAVAGKALPRGTRIEDAMVVLKPFLEESLPEGAIRDESLVEGRILLAALGGGEPVTESKLAPEGTVSLGVGDMIGPGRRAMSVRGNEVLGLGGFVHPGDRVDVLVTLDGVGKDRSPKTKLVLENVNVLATGTELSPTQDGGKPSPVDIYTVEVSPEQSEILALAATKGTLHFALRGAEDNATVVTTGKDVQATLSALMADAEPVKAKRARRAPKPAPSVELITGSQRTKVSFGARSSEKGPTASPVPSRTAPAPPDADLALGVMEGR
ncbi:MAG: Flp pilus assembly protein CpaB, partial [Desulfovibrionaceae bacterium]